jgi:hypothetical protein
MDFIYWLAQDAFYESRTGTLTVKAVPLALAGLFALLVVSMHTIFCHLIVPKGIYITSFYPDFRVVAMSVRGTATHYPSTQASAVFVMPYVHFEI